AAAVGAATLEADRAAHGVAQVDLAVDHVVPGRAVRVLEVRHERRGAGVERVDDHLALGRAGDLDPALEHVLRLRRDDPLCFADLLGLGEEVGARTGVELLLPRPATSEQLLAPAFEAPVELGGHSVQLVCAPAEVELFSKAGSRVRMPVKGRDGLVEVDSRKLPGKLSADVPTAIKLSGYDLVVLGMQEPQYRSPGVRELL